MGGKRWDEIEEDFCDSDDFNDAVCNYAERRGYTECDGCGLYSTECDEIEGQDLCPECYDDRCRERDEEERARDEEERAREKGLGHIEIDPRQTSLLEAV